MSRWTFYDNFQAFPYSRLHETDKRITAEVIVSHEAEGGGSLGGFVVRWFDFNGRWEPWRTPELPAPRLEAFSDSWQALADSGLVPILAGLGHRATVEQVKAALLEAGFVDRTRDLHRGPHPCPTCHGKGDISTEFPECAAAPSPGGTPEGDQG